MSTGGIEQSLFRVKDNCASEAEVCLAEENRPSAEASLMFIDLFIDLLRILVL